MCTNQHTNSFLMFLCYEFSCLFDWRVFCQSSYGLANWYQLFCVLFWQSLTPSRICIAAKEREREKKTYAFARFLLEILYYPIPVCERQIEQQMSVPLFVISEFCERYSCEGRPALRRVLWSKVTKATTCFRRSRGIPPLPNCGRPRKY